MYDSFIYTIVGFSVKVHPLKICLSIPKNFFVLLITQNPFYMLSWLQFSYTSCGEFKSSTRV